MKFLGLISFLILFFVCTGLLAAPQLLAEEAEEITVTYVSESEIRQKIDNRMYEYVGPRHLKSEPKDGSIEFYHRKPIEYFNLQIPEIEGRKADLDRGSLVNVYKKDQNVLLVPNKIMEYIYDTVE